MNSLVDRALIRALYEASQAGVRVDLDVRGICCLDRACRTSRTTSASSRWSAASSSTRASTAFQRGDERRYWIGSPDLMPRNLDTRVELLAPVEDERYAPSSRTRSSATSRTTPTPGSSADGRWTRRTGGTRRVHERADGARARARPSRRATSGAAAARARLLSASTRAAPRGCARGTPGHAGPRKQPRVDLVPARRARHQDQVRAGALIERSAAGRDPRAGEHGGGLEAVGDDHALEAEPPAQQPVTIARDCDAIRLGSSAG